MELVCYDCNDDYNDGDDDNDDDDISYHLHSAIYTIYSTEIMESDTKST